MNHAASKAMKTSWKYILAVISLAVAVLMVMDFNLRMAEVQRLTVEKERVSVKATSMVQTIVVLQTQLAYVTSDAAVEAWAREQAHMALPGEIPAQPMSPANSTPVPTPIPVITPQIVNTWQVWLSLFVEIEP